MIKDLGFPQEEISNSMTTIKRIVKRRLWRPNNYRRQIKVISKIPLYEHLYNSGLEKYHIKINKHTKVATVRYNNLLTIQVGKKVITGINSQRIIDGEKEVFCVEGLTYKDIEKEIKTIKDDIRDKIDKALFKFIREMGFRGVCDNPIWARHEDWTFDEEINKIPEIEIIHGEHFKKVYAKGVEFIGGKGAEPTGQLLNRVRNSGLREFAPDIVSKLEIIEDKLDSVNALSFLKANVRCPNDIFNYKDKIGLLSDEEKDEFSAWTFDNIALMNV